MNQESGKHGLLWAASEICYYLGLVLAAIFIPGLAFSLWMLSIADVYDPNYWYILIAWVLSILMFLAGIGLNNYIYWKYKKDEGNTE
jgi:membrane protein implicated in regulation of membrane protease activity